MERTAAPAPGRAAATAASPVPKPPTIMLASDLFIASAISLVRIDPDAPTSAPAMISAQLLITNPGIATAVTVNAFCFFFNDAASTEIYTLSLHVALPSDD